MTLTRTFSFGVVLFLAVGCAPDPAVGTFAFNLSGTDTETAPRSVTATVTGTGTLAITPGKTADYVVTLGHVDSTPCVLDAELEQKSRAINLVAGQKCTFLYSGGSVTATLTTGTISASDKGETVSVNLNYSYAGSIIGINFAGNGVRTYAGTRR